MDFNNKPFTFFLLSILLLLSSITTIVSAGEKTDDDTDSNAGGDKSADDDFIEMDKESRMPATSVPLAPPGSLQFPCAPSTISNTDYASWTPLQKLHFGVCFEANDSLVNEIINRTVQMEPLVGNCSEVAKWGYVKWAHIRPGLNDIDYYDEFHEEVPLPPEFLIGGHKNPKTVRVVNDLGFQYIYYLMTSGKAVCDILTEYHLPIVCQDTMCQCKKLVPNVGNDYTTHFSSFREKKKKPIRLEFNPSINKCTFPISRECTVQPNENTPGGNMIPCEDPSHTCVIKGNNVACTRRKMTKTIELYNDFANRIREILSPFRIHYPLECICTDGEVEEEIPPDGFAIEFYKENFKLPKDYEPPVEDEEDDDNGGRSLNVNIIWLVFSLLVGPFLNYQFYYLQNSC